MIVTVIALVHILAAETVAAAPAIDYSVAYGECTNAVRQSPEEALAKCEGPARAGIVGAQYVMGAVLVNRGDIAQGTEWLEKAVAAGSPPAAFSLASFLLQQKEPSAVTRGRELFKSAACAGYPEAIKALEEAGSSFVALRCPPIAETDFSGEWSIRLKWDKASPAGAATESYRVSIAGNEVHVSVLIADKWQEVKPGKFGLSQNDRSLTVAATDSGWDFDGKWIESWTLQLMRTSADDATVAYLRTVNNPYLPPQLKWKTFATFAGGTAHRTKP
ncbi:MAG: hypothetical protein ABI779_11470 [Acidobacteriota bacterium]